MNGEDYEAAKDEHRPDWPGYKQQHLPECGLLTPHTISCSCENDAECYHRCRCDRLRACEQRVTERHNAEHEDDRLTAFQNGYDAALVKERKRAVLLIADAYGKGVQAAREIVWDAECDCTRGTGEEHSPGCLTTPVLAAIDALSPYRPITNTEMDQT